MFTLEDYVPLYLLDAGNTKNVCDGAFGYAKRKLLTRYVKTPVDMMSFVEESSLTTTLLPSSHVNWRNWKDLLGKYFTIPNNLKITEGHVFYFSASERCKVRMKSLTTSGE